MPSLLDTFNRFRAVIFDFDGVIVDSETMQARAWTHVGAELGIGDCQITVAQIAGRVDHDLAAELFPGQERARCVARKWEIDDELEAAGALKLIDGVEDLVRRLTRTHALAICSSCNSALIARRLDRVGLRALFPVVVGRIDGLPHKPAPDLYFRALAELRVSSADACAIEDSPTGVAAAKAAGLYAIQLVHPGMPRSDEADESVGSLSELAENAPRADR